MPRKLKTYITSAGFFDLAVAAPTMKAALEAWGSERNLFQQGFARETDDPDIVAATMAKPGVVLKRGVGTSAAFSENAALPKSLPAEAPNVAPRPKARADRSKPAKPRQEAKVLSLADARAARQAAAAFEKERQRREDAGRREAIAREKERERRDAALRKAEAALEKALARHEEAAKDIAAERETLERRAEAEDARWEKEKAKLKDAIREARD